MICPECQAEYLDNFIECGDCKILLIDACAIDLPIPEMNWAPLPTFIGSTYSDMIVDVLNKKEIPHYVKNNWCSFSLDKVDNIIRVFVPKTYEQEATTIVHTIAGEKNETY